MLRNTSGLLRGGPGRQAGTPNRATAEIKSFCQRLVTDPGYRASFEERFRAGTLPPQVEMMVWNYAVGKPQTSVEVMSSGVSLAAIIAGRVPREDDEDEAPYTE